MNEELKGWNRTFVLALGGAIGALAGVLITAYLIHVSKTEEIA